MLETVNVVRTQRYAWSQAGEFGNSLRQLFQQHLNLESGQLATETEVDATTTEGQVPIGLPMDIELERVIEDVLVTIARQVPERDSVTARNVLTANLGVLRCSSSEVLHGC
jgi:hypothetical protein